MLKSGMNFTKASAITVSPETTRDARLSPVISPAFGHGSNPDIELDALAVILNVRVQGDADNPNFSVINGFRSTGIITSVLEYNPEPDEEKNEKEIDSASSSELTNMITIVCNNTVDTDKYVPNEFIVGNDSGAIARIVDVVDNTIRCIKPVDGTNYLEFTAGEVVYLLNDPVIPTSPPEISEIIKPTYQPLSGTILFINNRETVERSSTQIETFNFILKL